MSSRLPCKLAIGLVIAALAFGQVGCTDQDTTSSLIDLASSTMGGLVEILIKALLTDWVSQNQDPNLTAPISEQTH